jgi:hypothetical protein
MIIGIMAFDKLKAEPFLKLEFRIYKSFTRFLSLTSRQLKAVSNVIISVGLFPLTISEKVLEIITSVSVYRYDF